MDIVYLQSAASDLDWMRRYYTQVFPEGMKRAQKQFRAMEKILLTSPRIGKPTDFENVRELVLDKTPFSIIYRLKPDRIEVLRIWDNRADRTKMTLR